jgi:hypothetical protein
VTLLLPSAAQAAFGFRPGTEGFSAAALNADGSPTTQSGAHPHAFKTAVGLDAGSPDASLRDLSISLPPGFLVNPTAVAECSRAAFQTPRSTSKPGSLSGESCPNSSQVGVVRVEAGGTTRYFGLFNLVSPQGSAASIGASPFGVPLVFDVHLREPDNLSLELVGLSQSLDLRSLRLTIWGTPWWGDTRPSETHDPQRGNCLDEESGGSLASNCQVFGPGVPAPEGQTKSYLTMPTTPCGQPLEFTATAISWQGVDSRAVATAPALTKCNKALTTPKVQLMTDIGAARTGLAFNLAVNDGGGILNPGGIARPAIRTAIASLPEGLTINPSLGVGLGVCEEADFARETPNSEPGTGCPNASKIGTVTVEGALGLAEPLQGSIYLARPYANPFGTLLSVYMLARSPRRGLIVKSVGKIEPDLATGRLIVTFEDLPRLLYTHFTLTLREGQRSTLISPPACGTYWAGLDIASWAEPTVFKHESSGFAINRGEGGGLCPGGGAPPFAPGLLAGSINPIAGAYTPFYLRVTRADGEQEITSYSATLPPGLLAKLAGVATCPDTAIAAAATRSGAQEQESPSCPAASSIGRTMAGYGVGDVLAWAPGGLYLAGPYHGAPLSIAAIDAATIGPFDLGTVVVRQAIRVDPRSGQVSLDPLGSDPIPHILGGIPLHLRDIRVYVDRPSFMVNPTSCDAMQASSHVGGAGPNPFDPADDTSADSGQRYQVLSCSALGFRPGLSLRLRGSTKHGGYPSLRAVYRPRHGANLKAVSVRMPPSTFLAQEHIDQVCTRVQFAAGNCPAGSVYGRARALTPLLDEPLVGPVYLRSSRTAVPDLVADLYGRGIEIEVPGRIDSSRGGIRANFESLPDAPVTSFTMTLFGGKRGLIANAEAPCQGIHRANGRFVAQSNLTAIRRTRVRAQCKPAKRKGKKQRAQGGRGR